MPLSTIAKGDAGAVELIILEGLEVKFLADVIDSADIFTGAAGRKTRLQQTANHRIGVDRILFVAFLKKTFGHAAAYFHKPAYKEFFRALGILKCCAYVFNPFVFDAAPDRDCSEPVIDHKSA